jgi:ABC-type dipeptide/oligopeptide/nickel transport system permease subunit
MRLKRDKVAIGGGVVIILLVLTAIFGPYLLQSPLTFHQDLIDPTFNRPKGGVLHTGISADHPLGVEPGTGRDMLSRIVNGARISLIVASLATVLSVVIGVLFGVVSGYFGGWIDQVIGRVMDIFLAFPILLFAIALVGVVPDKAFGLQGNQLRVLVLVFVIGFFNWPYIGRIIRGQTLSLREREFVDAARSLGARPTYILFRELLPNLVAPIIVYSTLLIPTNILFEAGLSYLGVGVTPPTPSWGGMLTLAVPIYSSDPMYMVVPGMAIFITVLAFNLLGDGLRDALDPRSK